LWEEQYDWSINAAGEIEPLVGVLAATFVGVWVVVTVIAHSAFGYD
jgi:hypothetical protein